MSSPVPFPGAPAAPGTVLAGRYELRSPLGRGGMATVWRAHDRVLARDVAVKVFSAPAALPDAAARAAAEVRLLASLNHPNLVQVYDAVGPQPGGYDVLVMELVDGRSLRARLDEGPLAPDATALLGADVAAGLDHVHERGIVHRDVKPANVLLEETTRGTRAKLADFGVARLLEGSALTEHGTTVGTANYLSPEQALGEDVGPASDVYSLGLVLLECLTGAMTYPGSGVPAALARLTRAPAIPVELDGDWQQLLGSMTDEDPAARPTAAQVEARLRALALAPGTPSTPLDTVPTDGDTAVLPLLPFDSGVFRSDRTGSAVDPASRRGRRRGMLVPVLGGAAAVLAVLLGLGSLAFGGDDRAPAAPVPTTSPAAESRAPSSPAARTTTPPASSSSAAPTVVRRTTAATTHRSAPRTVVVVRTTTAPRKAAPKPAPAPRHGGPGKGHGHGKKP